MKNYAPLLFCLLALSLSSCVHAQQRSAKIKTSANADEFAAGLCDSGTPSAVEVCNVYFMVTE